MLCCFPPALALVRGKWLQGTFIVCVIICLCFAFDKFYIHHVTVVETPNRPSHKMFDVHQWVSPYLLWFVLAFKVNCQQPHFAFKKNQQKFQESQHFEQGPEWKIVQLSCIWRQEIESELLPLERHGSWSPGKWRFSSHWRNVSKSTFTQCHACGEGDEGRKDEEIFDTAKIANCHWFKTRRSFGNRTWIWIQVWCTASLHA